MIDLAAMTRLLLANGYLRSCDHHPHVVIDDGVGGRPEDIARALAARSEGLGAPSEVASLVRAAIAAAADQCALCEHAVHA